ncbi:hypothetical protein GCM10011575_28750 [Microlunatus endophyticus]|uniref:Uncharacterized protein n=1 Tax=Microlunatus endophyticus TaxID=1716077 RepID=A0A917SCY5_9ACTN|nr:hypothetical protein [Microlunatus endophyticus]GGL68376.1 hypothetical protein GCM10011575_28750 [Microlunatus endophyticus]
MGYGWSVVLFAILVGYLAITHSAVEADARADDETGQNVVPNDLSPDLD